MLQPQGFERLKNRGSHLAMRLPAPIRALLKPAAYPEHPRWVRLLQTHISYILLTPRYVYKIKKPVDFGFLDFTTLKRRLYFLKEELRLNRRLAPTTYIAVVPVVKTRRGYRVEEERGDVVEYALKMRHLKEECMLHNLIRKDTLPPHTIERIAHLIAGFHKEARTSPYISSFGSPRRILGNVEENFRQVAPFVGITISKDRFEEIKTLTLEFMKAHRRLFERRTRRGFIRDCHGDLHCEHISIEDGVEIFDCIEFNRRFRYSDIVCDMAFLSMDMDFRGRPDLAREFEEQYFSYRGDKEGGRLLDFYKAYRAYIRGKVEGFRLKEPEESEEDKSRALVNAALFFELACQYLKGYRRPYILLVCGLTGTGKSAVAEALKERLWGVKVLSTDAVRRRLFNIAKEEHRRAAYGKGIYTEEARDRVYRELLGEARLWLRRGRPVIVDATFSKRAHLELAKRSAKRCGADLYVVECTLDEKEVRRRLAQRLEEKTLSDATWQTYLRQKEEREPIENPTMRLSTTSPPLELADRIISTILARRV